MVKLRDKAGVYEIFPAVAPTSMPRLKAQACFFREQYHRIAKLPENTGFPS